MEQPKEAEHPRNDQPKNWAQAVSIHDLTTFLLKLLAAGVIVGLLFAAPIMVVRALLTAAPR